MHHAAAPPFDPWLAASTAAEVVWAGMAPPGFRARQAGSRLRALLQHARAHSPLMRERLAGFDLEHFTLADLPTLPRSDKRLLMDRFDDWVTDRTLRRDALRAFTADPARIGDAYGGRYTVWESSGSSGEPALFVQDAACLAVYDALETLRRPDAARWLSAVRLAGPPVFVGALDGHFASNVSLERLRRLNPWLAPRLHALSFLQSTDALAAQLNELQPGLLATYPTVALLLAEAQQAGRLHIRPGAVCTGGETLTPCARDHVAQAFGCAVHDSYGASEFLALAAACRLGRLHLNDDWALLEPVDEHGRPVPDGQPGATTLLTNLANRVQPILRYDLGDRVTLRGHGCACGSTLPVIEVQGRADDLLRVAGPGGREVGLAPLALCTVLEEGAGVFDFQLCRVDARTLELRLGEGACAEAGSAERALQALQEFLRQQGVPQVRVHIAAGPIGARGRSGKLKRVIAGMRLQQQA
jgi:phenylacetate-coenzyme A ligase PaaK-like adenylate-forming protein